MGILAQSGWGQPLQGGGGGERSSKGSEQGRPPLWFLLPRRVHRPEGSGTTRKPQPCKECPTCGRSTQMCDPAPETSPAPFPAWEGRSPNPHTYQVWASLAHTPEDFTSSLPTVWGWSPLPHTRAGADRLPGETLAGRAVCAGPAQLLWESWSPEPKLEAGSQAPGKAAEGGFVGWCGRTQDPPLDRWWGLGTGRPGRAGGPGRAQGPPQSRQGRAALISSGGAGWVGGGFAKRTQMPPTDK